MNAICDITTFEPGRRVAWKGVGEGIEYEAEYRFDPVDGGCRLTYASTTVLGGRWLDRREEYEREWQGKSRAELQQLKAMLEGQPAEA